MSSFNSDVLSKNFPTDWPRAEHLLPGYLKKTLTPLDQQWMEQWITQVNAGGGSAAEALKAETAWVRAAQDVLSNATTVFNAQAGWQKLQADLNAEVNTNLDANVAADSGANLAAKSNAKPNMDLGVELPSQAASTAQTTVPVFAKLKRWLAKIALMQQDRALQWWQKPAVGVLGSAMIIGQMGFLAAAVKQLYVAHTDTTLVSPSSGASRPIDGVLIKVIFKPTASIKEVMNVLSSVQGRVTGGPGALGIWEVEVPADKVSAALDLLAKAKAVEAATRE